MSAPTLTLVVSAILITSFATPARAQAAVNCPLGANDTELTIQRVMMNFGKYTTKADDIAVGTTSPATDADIEAAAKDLEIVEACAEAVVQGNTEALTPSRASDVQGADRARFITAFKQAMAQFESLVADYAAALRASNGTNPRDLTQIIAKKDLVDQAADEAHKHF